MPAPSLTVLYDADCGFCRWSVAQLLALDRGGRLMPEPIQSAVGGRLLAGIAPAERLASAHVVTADGRVASGGDAVALVAEVVPGAAVTVPLARALAPASRAAYRLVASNRGPLGRRITPAMRDAADVRIATRRAGRR